jgi:hypothetical protein
LLCLAIIMSIVGVAIHFYDKRHPFQPDRHIAFGHIEISVERPIETEIERPAPTPLGPDFV